MYYICKTEIECLNNEQSKNKKKKALRSYGLSLERTPNEPQLPAFINLQSPSPTVNLGWPCELL